MAVAVADKLAELKIRSPQAQKAHHRFGREIRNLRGEQAVMGVRDDTIKTFGLHTKNYLHV
jgi:hypothetical protein